MALTNSPWWVPFSPSFQAVLFCDSSGDNVYVGTEGNTLLVQNEGSKTAYISFGATNLVAAVAQPSTTSSTPEVSQAILAGAIISFLLAPNMTYVAGITAGADETVLRLSRGSGQ